MIQVKCVGHIGTSLGRENVELDVEEIMVEEMIEKLRGLSVNPEGVGFNRYNTLVIVEDGEAFVPASKERMLKEGERVVVIPFSHGG